MGPGIRGGEQPAVADSERRCGGLHDGQEGVEVVPIGGDLLWCGVEAGPQIASLGATRPGSQLPDVRRQGERG